MTLFEMVKYHGQEYPKEIPIRIEEIAAHFDITTVEGRLGYSLHTEYSYGKRNLNSALILNYPEIRRSQKDGVPQLWKNQTWASQFADFIFALVGDDHDLRVVEIHPPFNDYTTMEGFIEIYTVFESKILERFPNVEILIENRCGSFYRGGKFILSKIQDIEALCDAINREGIKLRIAYDVPQIYTAHNAKKEGSFIGLLQDTKPYRAFIGGVHLWGKKTSDTGRRIAHCGNLDTYFGDMEIKNSFLNEFKDCFDDGKVRKMVLEVNSGNEDLLSIVSDLGNAEVVFV